MVEEKLKNFIANKVRSIAQGNRDSAGYNGEWGDRGASNMEDKLNFWLDGLAGRIPKEYQQYADAMTIENDPEYQEFKRLKAKFGGN